MLSIVVTGWNLPSKVKYTTAALRKAFGAVTFSLSGSIGTGDIADGSVTPSKLAPGTYFYGGTGTYATKTYTVTMSPPLGALADGVAIRFKAAADCEDASILLTVNGLPAKQIFKGGGSVGLVAGDIRANQVVEVVYCAALASGSGGWLITGLVGNPEVFAGTGGGTANAQTCTCTVPAKSLAALAGKRVQYVATVENTAGMTLAIDGLTAKSVLKDDGQALRAGDVKVGELVDLVYVPTAAGGAGAFLLRGTRAAMFTGSDAGASDAYAMTIASFPAAWVTGVVVAFKANTANTGPATVTVTPLGGVALAAVTLKKRGLDLDSNDIQAGQWVQCVYDGTSLQVINVGEVLATAEQNLPALGATLSVAHGQIAPPRIVRWVMVCKTADSGFAVNDEVDLWFWVSNVAGNPFPNNLQTWADLTNMKVKYAAQFDTVTPANWRLKAYYIP